MGRQFPVLIKFRKTSVNFVTRSPIARWVNRAKKTLKGHKMQSQDCGFVATQDKSFAPILKAISV
ncbi:hypothetical protein D2U88_14720 [Flagellimonas aequoris]|uniref:Uncharacterized protein n=1 Tax=Flagellimonas aequoris TaxID=2306997 RepID=A0A418N3Q5_9FLAO|nr:hypothetical protein D2U88_14720 [Allomuricauda aequoris]